MSEGVADLSLAELTPPVVLLPAQAPEVPLIFTSPHSGLVYPTDFVAASRLDPMSLRRSEDSFVDSLFDEVPQLGAPLLCARFPRAFCDANREKWELDPSMFADPLPAWVVTRSPRISAGLGTVARLVSSGEAIYREKLRLSEVESRIEHCWQGFHDALAAEIARLREKFGFVVLIDCHSMPRSSQMRAEKADIILGDAHGVSCAPTLVRQAEESLQSQDFVVRRNDPYAGGYITRHYGRPREAVHAMQIEICRSLYMDEARFEKNRQFDDIRGRLRNFAATMAEHAATYAS